jgi:hypothetical protein
VRCERNLLDANTTRIEGWLSTDGEWTLFQTSDFTNYNPYVDHEEMKCISVVNNTGKLRSTFHGLHGKQVVIDGFVRNDELDSGSSAGDVLLSKKYFNREVVENFCLRDHVFIASEIRKSSNSSRRRHGCVGFEA